ncbi:MAG: M20/M25/M40 family metallo-hydrolase [Thermoanaerobaculia bacterium]
MTRPTPPIEAAGPRAGRTPDAARLQAHRTVGGHGPRPYTVAIALVAAGLISGAALADVGALRDDAGYLASDELEGRMTGSEGASMAVSFLTEQLEGLGARPLPGHDGYALPFTFTAGTRDAGSSVSLQGHGFEATWDDAEHVQALAFSQSDTVTAPVVFAGYGLVVPDGDEVIYDSYAGLEVEGKIVLVLRYSPEDTEGDFRAQLARYSGLRYKALQARERGALALLVVTGPTSPNAGETVPLTFDTAISGSGLVAASISGEVAEALFAASPDHELEATQKALDSGNPHVAGFDLGPEITLQVAIEREEKTAHNVVGYFPGTDADALEKPWVVLGAHFDHLGRGRSANSLADASEADAIHHGADDNASGVATVLEAARSLAGEEHRRNVAVAFWSGEELGVLGSTAFLRDEVLDPTTIAAYVNLDMVGRMRENKLTLQAVGSSAEWPGLIERTNVPVGFDLQLGEDPYLPTDSSPFNQEEVPSLQLFTGSHEDYHKPSDTADKLDYEDMERIARFTDLLVGKLADLDAAPEFVKVAPTHQAGAGDRETVRAYTGTIPDYTTEVEGLRLSGVIEGGPAASAGLQEGDVIVQFGATTIANIYDYTYALDAVKIGEETKIVYLRDGERRETTITPTARE